MSIGPDRWHSSHLRCVALFNVVFFFRHACGRVWRGAVQFITHPSQYPTLVCNGSLVGLCVRVPRARQVFTAAQMQVALFARSRLVARWYLVLVSSGVSHVASATPSCPEVGTSLGRACLRARFARWGGGRSRHRLCVHLRRSLALVSLVVFGLSRRSGVRPRGEWGGGCRWAVGGRGRGLHALTSVSCPAAAARRSFSLTYASAHAQRPPSLFLGGRVGLVESRTWQPCACDSSDIE